MRGPSPSLFAVTPSPTFWLALGCPTRWPCPIRSERGSRFAVTVVCSIPLLLPLPECWGSRPTPLLLRWCVFLGAGARGAPTSTGRGRWCRLVLPTVSVSLCAPEWVERCLIDL